MFASLSLLSSFLYKRCPPGLRHILPHLVVPVPALPLVEGIPLVEHHTQILIQNPTGQSGIHLTGIGGITNETAHHTTMAGAEVGALH